MKNYLDRIWQFSFMFYRILINTDILCIFQLHSIDVIDNKFVANSDTETENTLDVSETTECSDNANMYIKHK